jgi:hypothetical protein
MSYDIYCFRPSSDVPTLEEAHAIVESEETGGQPEDSVSLETKRKIVSALIEYNPGLKPFKFDYPELARKRKISEEQARQKFNHIQLDPSEGELAIQLTVFSDHIFICIPYWYRGSQADAAFAQLENYLRVIRNAAGYFAYDPQVARVLTRKRKALVITIPMSASCGAYRRWLPN